MGTSAPDRRVVRRTAHLRLTQLDYVLSEVVLLLRPAEEIFLEVCVFLGRTVKAPQVKRVDTASKSKVVHFFQIRHRDEVEAPFTDWLREAYELSPTLGHRKKSARTRVRKS